MPTGDLIQRLRVFPTICLEPPRILFASPPVLGDLTFFLTTPTRSPWLHKGVSHPYMAPRTLFARSRCIPSQQHTVRYPFMPHPNSLNPPRPQVHQHSTNNLKIRQSRTEVNGRARGVVLVRWTRRLGYFLGLQTTVGSALCRHAKNVVRARQKSVSLPPCLPLILPRSFSDQWPALLSHSVPASIQNASDALRGSWNANTPPSAACGDPTGQSPHCPHCQMGPRSPLSPRDRRSVNVPPPCPPFRAGDCRFGVSSRGSSTRNRNKASNNRSRARGSSLLLLPPPPPHH